MGTNYIAWNHKAWATAGLKDYGDYSDCIEYINQSEYGDGQLEGEWFWNDDEARTIYYGSFGNDNSPGADSYTAADVYDTEEEYREALAEWEAKPEYLDEDEDDQEEEETEPSDGDYITENERNYYQYGKLAVTIPTDEGGDLEDWRPHVYAHMKAKGFFPSVWIISDHGNAHLRDWAGWKFE
jgi:hypothetical protein